MKQSRDRKSSAHGGKTARALAALVALAAVFYLSVGAASAAGHESTTYYVNDDAAGENDGTSWADAFTDLQDALDAAVSGDAIWVAAGTYKPSAPIEGSDDPRTAAFILTSGVAIYGGFVGDETALSERFSDPGLTVLSGDIGTAGVDTDNSYHVVYADGVTDAVLDGFTVTSGRARGVAGQGSRDLSGGGMYASNSALTVSNCVFSDNRAWNDGGGMYNIDSALTVSDCLFSGNKAGDTYNVHSGSGGGMYNQGTYLEISSTVTGCTFEDNEAEGWSTDWAGGGGGMYNLLSRPTVDRCAFERNWTRGDSYHGGGMLVVAGAAIVTNCVFNGNWSANGGGMANVTAAAFIINCTFYGNGWAPWPPGSNTLRAETRHGGAIYEDRSSGSRIVDVVFSGNAAYRDNVDTAGGGALYSEDPIIGGSLTLTRCLLYGNVRWNPNQGSASDHMVIPSWATTSNLLYDVDPLLADPENGDFHLQEGSPCIDTGITLRDACRANRCWLPLPETDFEGDSRLIDGDGLGGKTADIGADEYLATLEELHNLILDLASIGQIDGWLAEALLDDVDHVQAALDDGYPETAKYLLEEMITWLKTLEDNETTELILRKSEAVHGTLD